VLILGCIGIGLFAFSNSFQRHFRYFITTNFYINKYEYRNEWLTLSEELQGALTENDVISALCHVLSESLYTSEIFIWLGEPSTGYRLAYAPVPSDINNAEFHISGTDPLTYFILGNGYFHMNEENKTPSWQHIADEKSELLKTLYLTLITPISVGDHPVGFIGLGPEFTNGSYGHDDFDLLKVLGSQTASTLMAIRIAEKLANTREQEAWNSLSSFVLHDIKNAASMLSLLQENAPAHIHEPEFQQDMLDLVDDALNRMGRVEQRLMSLKDEIIPNFQAIEIGAFLKDSCSKMSSKLQTMDIQFEQQNKKIFIQSDPALLLSIFENILINAFEARREGVMVRIETKQDTERGTAIIKISDNGPGIKEELLPDTLFEPFKTDKQRGSGIGLWQVQKVISSLNGKITARNTPQGGAQFTIMLPLSSGIE
jgi:putative PEP-CTERM system histidine kinase